MIPIWHWIALSLALAFGGGVGIRVWHMNEANILGTVAAAGIACVSAFVILMVLPIGWIRHDRAEVP